MAVFASGSGVPGGFPRSDHTRIQFNWRDDPNIDTCRQDVSTAVARYLAGKAVLNFEQIPALAAKLEYQLFMQAISKEDYLNDHTFFSRLAVLIEYEYYSKYHLPMNPGSDCLRAKCANLVITDTPQYCLPGSSLNPMAGVQMSPDRPGVSVPLIGRKWKRSIESPHICSAWDRASDIQPGDSGLTYSGRDREYLTNDASPRAVRNLVTTDNQQYCFPEFSLQPMAGEQMNADRQAGVSPLGKLSLNKISPYNEQCISSLCSPREALSDIQPIDSRPTFCGRALNYESEPSFGDPIGLMPQWKTLTHSDSGGQLPVPSKFRKMNPPEDGLSPVMGSLPSLEANLVITDTPQYCLPESSLNPMAGAQMHPYREGVNISPRGRKQKPSIDSPHIFSAWDRASDIQPVDSGPTYSRRHWEYLTNNALPAYPGSNCFRAACNLMTTDNQQYCLPELSLQPMAGEQMSADRQVDVSPFGKPSLDKILPYNEQCISRLFSAKEALSDIQLIDSGPTFCGSVINFESESLFGAPIVFMHQWSTLNHTDSGGQLPDPSKFREWDPSEDGLSPVMGSLLILEEFPILQKSSPPPESVNFEAAEVDSEMITVHQSKSTSSGENRNETEDVPQNANSEVLPAVSEEAFVDCKSEEMQPATDVQFAGKAIGTSCTEHSEAAEVNPEMINIPRSNSSSNGENWNDTLDAIQNANSAPAVSEEVFVDCKSEEMPPDVQFADEAIGGSCTEPSEAAEVNSEMITTHSNNSSNGSENRNDTEDAPQNANSEEVLHAVFVEAFAYCKPEEMQVAIDVKFSDDKAITTSGTEPSEWHPILTTEQPSKQNHVMVARNNCKGVIQDVAGESLLPATFFGTGMKPEKEKQKILGVSLTEFFTAEEVRQHIFSLRKICDQDMAKDLLTSTNHHTTENTCHLCGLDRLAFPPKPIYCSACSVRIKDHATYYFILYENGDPFCFCSTCYNKSRGRIITSCGFSVPKCKLEMKKNDAITEELWVQCDQCEGWQHQICALFNDRRDTGGKSEYICPKCYLDELGTGERMPLPRAAGFLVSNLQHTKLSEHIERRLFKNLKQEREERARVAGKNLDEVPEATDLAVRVVSSVDKLLRVKQKFLDILPDKSYPAELPYRSKAILLFQKIEGVDVCLFGMYVQEYGSECSRPNQRCVYVSYLDSVRYLRPEIRTVTGEALRTFIYHEVLIAYLEYCKKRGFATCYIWACPAVKGEDYIFYRHPGTQKTPKHEKLLHWYQAMLKKAFKEKIVVNYTNLYEQFFVPIEDCNTKITVARLPYFDGDYWPPVAENILEKIEQECGEDLQKRVKKFTRRTLKAMGHSNPSDDDAKDILLMDELGRDICSAKEDYLVVHLQPVCTHCHEVILSGKKRFCNQCRNYQLCERCHDPRLGSIHSCSSCDEHELSEVVNDLPVNTEDNDVMMNNCFLENRSAFLSFCQGNNYQFDTLRRAKHSSMMILYHLHNNPDVAATGRTMCSLCRTEIMVDPQWKCEICTGFSVCAACYQRNGAACHSHQLTRYPPVVDCSRPRCKKADMLRRIESELLSVLVHASKCCASTSRCLYPNCEAIRKLFFHAHSCKIRAAAGCVTCKKTWSILKLHSQKCRDPNCGVPRCMDLKKHEQALAQRSNAPHRDTVVEVGVQLAAKS